MITDRISSASLMGMLITAYPQYAFAMVASLALDIGSHWAHMYTTLVLGESHHKRATFHFWILKMYYHKKFIMAPLIVGFEGFLLSFYILRYEEAFANKAFVNFAYVVYYLSLPLFLFKQVPL